MIRKNSKTSFLNFFRLLFRNRIGEALLYPLTRGKQWNNFFARIPANYYQYKTGSVRNVVREGFNYHLDISDYMQWLIYFGVSIEPREVLYAHVKPGMVIMDIGANIGETAMHMSRITGNEGVVHAFEPDPYTFEKLVHHITTNNIQNICIHPFGLGDADGAFTLERNAQHSGGNRINAKASGSADSVEVKIQNGDQIVTSGNFKPDLIKIDVEGFELHVLKGLENTIRKYRPVLYVEVIDAYLEEQQTSADEVIAWLHAHSYVLTNSFTGKLISATDPHTGLHCDIIATPA